MSIRAGVMFGGISATLIVTGASFLYLNQRPQPVSAVSRFENVPIVDPFAPGPAPEADLYATLVQSSGIPSLVGFTIPLRGLAGDTLYTGTNDRFGPTAMQLIYHGGTWKMNFMMTIVGGFTFAGPLLPQELPGQIPDGGPTDDPVGMTFTLPNQGIVWRIHQ
jgi:hypothetical protein